MNNISNNLAAIRHPNPFVFGCQIVCAVSALEMTIRAVYDAVMIGKNSTNSTTPHHDNLSADLGGAIFYGLCAVQPLPYTAVVGSIIFVAYSIFKTLTDEDYFIARFLKGTAEKISNLATPIIREFVWPLIEKVIDAISYIRNCISMPEHPVWYGVALLITGIIIVHGIIPAAVAVT